MDKEIKYMPIKLDDDNNANNAKINGTKLCTLGVKIFPDRVFPLIPDI